MKILFDSRFTFEHENRGIGRYCNGLLATVSAERPDIELTTLSERSLVELGRLPNAYYDFLVLPQLYPYSLSDEWDRLERFLPYECVRVSKRIVGIIHDLIPMIFASHYLKEPNRMTAAVLGTGLARSLSHCFAVSKSASEDLIEISGIESDRVSVIYGGANQNWTPKEGTRTNDVIYIGGWDFRKNLEGCVRGFAEYRRSADNPNLRLIVASDIKKEGRRELLNLAGKDAARFIHIPGYLEQIELINLVRQARASIFPSRYEGLGLPILESYAVNTPVYASNVSSMKEITHPECQFDPYSQTAIAKAFADIQDGGRLAKSREFGAALIQKLNWKNTTGRFVAELERLDKIPLPSGAARKEIAVFAAMPPEQTGVGVCSARTFMTLPDTFDIFAAPRTRTELEACISFARREGLDLASVFANDAFDDLNEERAYNTALFVLGNSEHNVPVLRRAIGTSGRGNLRRMAYVHDGWLGGLWWNYFHQNLEALKACFRSYYGSNERLNKSNEISEIVEAGYLGFLPLVRHTGISELIVNSSVAEEQIRRDLRGEIEVRFHRAFHPIYDLRSRRRENGESSHLRIGHFGIPSNEKGVGKLVAAAALIAKKRPTTLVLAGWRAKQFCQARISASHMSFVEPHDGPGEEELVGLMEGADVCVQLREIYSGESSGVLAHLIGLGKTPLVTENAFDPKFRPWVRPLPKGVSVEDLAEAIERFVEQPARSTYRGEFSTREAAKCIQRICRSEDLGSLARKPQPARRRRQQVALVHSNAP